MKHLLILIILAGSLLAADVKLTITIPEEFVPEFTEAFLAYKPVPLVDNPAHVDDPNQPQQIKEYTNKKWVEKLLKRVLFNWIEAGKRKLREQQAGITDPNMIQ